MDNLGIPVDKSVVHVLTTWGALPPTPTDQHVSACGSNYMHVSNGVRGVFHLRRVACTWSVHTQSGVYRTTVDLICNQKFCHTQLVPTWEDYQQDAARYFSDLGFCAQTDQRIEGSRGHHDVDVAVRGSQAGVEFLWVVECKQWRTRVPKEKVAALVSIVEDVGADRGILLSESGFQSGAHLFATGRNITLANLNDLRKHTSAELAEYQVSLLKRERKRLSDLLGDLAPVIKRTQNTWTHRLPKALSGSGPTSHLAVVGRLAMIEMALERALSGEWPVWIVIYKADGSEHRHALKNLDEVKSIVGAELNQISKFLTEIHIGEQT